jgi:uncharacterized protein YjiS (DUF1127 family)
MSVIDLHFGRPVAAPGRLAGALSRWRRDRRRRRAFRRLLDLDDRTLRDIGLTRGEVEIAAALPLSWNASQVAHDMAWHRRKLGM